MESAMCKLKIARFTGWNSRVLRLVSSNRPAGVTRQSSRSFESLFFLPLYVNEFGEPDTFTAPSCLFRTMLPDRPPVSN